MAEILSWSMAFDKMDHAHGDGYGKTSSRQKGEVVHSGHFMMSSVAEQEDVTDNIDHDRDSPIHHEQSIMIKHGYDFTNVDKETRDTYQFGTSQSNKITIDASLARLFQCMSLAYRGGKVVSPKWKNFKGMKLTVKDKIRLNNAIWRTWHIQYVIRRGKDNSFIQFVTPSEVETDAHCRPEAVVLEGKYWKRRIETVVAEYKKWRSFFLDRWMSNNQPSPVAPDSVGSKHSDGQNTDFSDSLFSNLSQQPFQFPNPREIAMHATNSDMIQPGLLQLQPFIDDMDFDPLQEFFTNTKKPVSVGTTFTGSTAVDLISPSDPFVSNDIMSSFDNRLFMQQHQNGSLSLSVVQQQPQQPPQQQHQQSPHQQQQQQPSKFVGPAFIPEQLQDVFTSAGIPDHRSNADAMLSSAVGSSSAGGSVADDRARQKANSFVPISIMEHPEHSSAIPQLQIRQAQYGFADKFTYGGNKVAKPVPIQPHTAQKPMEHSSQVYPHSKQGAHQPLNKLVYTQTQMPMLVDPPLQHLDQELSDVIAGPSQARDMSKVTEQQTLVINVTGGSHFSKVDSVQISPKPATDSNNQNSSNVILLKQLLSNKSVGHSASSNAEARKSSGEKDGPRILKGNIPAVFERQGSELESVQNEMEHQSAWPTVSTTRSTADSSPQEHETHQCTSFDMEACQHLFQRAGSFSAEQKRRFNIKLGFSRLQQFLPGASAQSNTKISKASLMNKATQYIKSMQAERAKVVEEIQALKQEMEDLEKDISVCQQQLPVTGVPLSKPHMEKCRPFFDRWLSERTEQEWKFYLFGVVIDPWFESYQRLVSTESVHDLQRSVFAWVDQKCALPVLRPSVVQSLQVLGTTTVILTQPTRLQRQIEETLRHKRNKRDARFSIS